jgi:hypothetical protein
MGGPARERMSMLAISISTNSQLEQVCFTGGGRLPWQRRLAFVTNGLPGR